MKEYRLLWLGKLNMHELSFRGTFYGLHCFSSYISKVSSGTLWNKILGNNEHLACRFLLGAFPLKQTPQPSLYSLLLCSL